MVGKVLSVILWPIAKLAKYVGILLMLCFVPDPGEETDSDMFVPSEDSK
jgi:hypothetical protein